VRQEDLLGLLWGVTSPPGAPLIQTSQLMVPMRQSSGTSKHQEAPQLLHLVPLHPAELHLRILALRQVARVTDMEKAVATTTEEEGEEEEEGEVLLMVVVVALPVTNIEVEEIGEAGHRNRDPKGGTF